MKTAFRSAAAAATLVAAACVDSSTPTAPGYLEPKALAATGALLIGAPDLNDPRSFEGQLFVCKDGSPTGVNFDFDYEIRNTVTNTVVASGTTTVPVGSCVLAASVPTNVSGRFEATVTEQTPPAYWTLTDITYAYGVGINPPAPTIDLPTRTISALRMSNDAGVMTVFTNTFDPPTPVGCTLTQGYWKTHPQDWDSAADGHLFTTTSTFYNSGMSYYDIMWTNPSGGNAYIQLAHQFIAASLNLDGASSGIAAVDAAMAGAAAYFPTAPAGIPTPSGALRTQLQGWATTLDNFNNGLLGVPHC
jgi:hypothetical protein